MTGNSSTGLRPAPIMSLDPVTLDPEPLIRSGRNWTRWVGPLVSVLTLVVALHQFRDMDPASLWALVPGGIAFWAAFTLYYLAGPLSEWAIFRRLWSIPADGFVALLRKLVSNEILLGYLGEVYFYAWARRHARITTAPFGAIKDVTILSALVGNGVTLVMVALALPLLHAVDARLNTWEMGGSILFVLATSLVVMLLRKRLFTLPRRELRIVAAIHLLRIVATTMLAAAMWHMLLPGIALSWWMLLGTLRQLVSRLPFLPNKDVVFAGMAAFLIGRDSEIVSAMALMASLILVAHLIVGMTLGAVGLLREGQTR
ncbi:hypothetical protein Q4610_11040 [Sphingobium sp. HBC34]|uniref:Flippase-like domain-containing protein n=1 Tax=Sphingobium cyanobacteriorum TaxID=3063954 RepID=A0ABT8ZMF2_9SPHN|nr:hypothetical protein [Sphingobium sp. HBC34]MDO7835578.1 hypothetical protein [Sphingobium sp. HBC34]